MKNFKVLRAVALAAALFFSQSASRALAMPADVDVDQLTTRSGGFSDFIYELRRNGLDVVLVIDGTGSMNLVINDFKAKMAQLVYSMHRLVPNARIGIVVFGGKGEKTRFQPLTLSAEKLSTFLTIQAVAGGKSEDDIYDDRWAHDTYGACERAIETTDWKPDARKVVVLVGDSPPEKKEFNPLLELIHKFKDNKATFNTLYIAPKISPLPDFSLQIPAAYKVLASAGGGSMKSVTNSAKIDQQLLILAFGDQWRSQVEAFSSSLGSGGGQ